MKTATGEELRSIIEDEIKYLLGVATDYALRYANTDSQEDKSAYLKYKFASDQLDSIRIAVSLKVTDFENQLSKKL